MSTESLKRVLMGIKNEARSMKKEQLMGRFAPKKDETQLDGSDSPIEGSDAEENSESPEEAAAENDAELGIGGDAPDKEDEVIAEIKKLLARV